MGEEYSFYSTKSPILGCNSTNESEVLRRSVRILFNSPGAPLAEVRLVNEVSIAQWGTSLAE